MQEGNGLWRGDYYQGERECPAPRYPTDSGQWYGKTPYIGYCWRDCNREGSTVGLQERAAELAGYLVWNTREGERRIVVKADNAPEWVADVVRAVHGDLFPDDWTYATIKEAASAIEDDGKDAELEPDIYNSHLLAWLQNYPDAIDSCDRAVEDYGSVFGSIMEQIQAGQQIAKAEIVAAVIAQLETLADDDDDAEGE